MHPEFPRLFSSFRLGSHDLRNRLVALPHGTSMVRDGVPTADDLEHFTRLARGGVGLIISGGTSVHPTSSLRSRKLVEAYNDEVLPALERRARVVHDEGATLFGQILHLGRELIGGDSDYAPSGPSTIKSPRDPFPPHELAVDEIEEIVAAFAHSAANLESAGYDGVEIQAAHGYLVAQFLSPATNQRSDAYGGSFDGRFRFLRLVVDAVRERCSPEFALGVRFSAEEEIPGGLTVDDTCRIAEELARVGGIDYLNVTHGTRGLYVKDMSSPDGVAVASAAKVKRASGLTTLVGQRIRGPHLAEDILRTAAADLVGMARGLIADPDLPRKAAEGRTAEIRTCIGVNQDCRDHDPHLHCAINAEVGRSRPTTVGVRVDRPKSVYVIGGGPGGLEAARVAANRGHRVTVFERERLLGGQLRVAAAAPHRGTLIDIVDYLGRELKRLRVDVNLGAEITLEDLLAMPGEADTVILATGSAVVRQPIGGDQFAATVDDVLLGRVDLPVGGEAVVVDDGDGFWPAYNAAEKLALAGLRVTVVTPAMAAAARLPHESIGPLLRRLGESGVRLLPHHALVSASAGQVVVAALVGGEQSHLRADVLVWHAGRRVEDSLYREGRERVDLPLIPLGDCITPRQLGHAIADGYRVGARI